MKLLNLNPPICDDKPMIKSIFIIDCTNNYPLKTHKSRLVDIDVLGPLYNNVVIELIPVIHRRIT